MDKTAILKQYFGHSSFRSGQDKLIDHILSGRDCLGVMPTGAGKSMCYQIPALMMEGTTIVISPLISLMKDQVEALIQAGVSAAFLNSSLEPYEMHNILTETENGRYKILYIAPERLSTEYFGELCGRIKVPLIAVDEAHCVSHWGQDFRPSYLRIAEFVNSLPERPVVAAFTATATNIVKDDIVSMLQLNDPFRITTGFDRSNLYFEVRRPESSDRDEELLRIMNEAKDRTSIIYCATRKNVEHVCSLLQRSGFNAAFYHAGLADEVRRRVQDDFIFDRVNIMVATNAFGMGIDKSDVSLVVHYNMPKDVESYYQEAGRAGRDGSPARCILLYTKGDVRTNSFLIEHSHEESDLSEDEIEAIRERDRERLKQMTFYSTTRRCLREFILRYFGERTNDFCGNCSSCNTNYDTIDITIAAQKILSCIFRLKQRGMSAGKQLMTDILCGRMTDEVKADDLSTLSTFGIMSDTAPKSIGDIIAYLISIEYIEEQEDGLHGTDISQEFIRARRTLLMKLPKRRHISEAIQLPPEEEPAVDAELFEQLKALRKTVAATLGVPAYVVFTDATLRDMSVKKPMTVAEFMNVSGIGSLKAQRYAKKFSEVIGRYKESHGL